MSDVSVGKKSELFVMYLATSAIRARLQTRFQEKCNKLRFISLINNHFITTREYSEIHLSVFNALMFETLDIERSFWYAGTSSEYLGHVCASRSLGQGQGHRRGAK